MDVPSKYLLGQPPSTAEESADAEYFNQYMRDVQRFLLWPLVWGCIGIAYAFDCAGIQYRVPAPR